MNANIYTDDQAQGHSFVVDWNFHCAVTTLIFTVILCGYNNFIINLCGYNIFVVDLCIYTNINEANYRNKSFEKSNTLIA